MESVSFLYNIVPPIVRGVGISAGETQPAHRTQVRISGKHYITDCQPGQGSFREFSKNKRAKAREITNWKLTVTDSWIALWKFDKRPLGLI
jgi:hypothetical protein